jgi:hypothetical protein
MISKVNTYEDVLSVTLNYLKNCGLLDNNSIPEIQSLNESIIKEVTIHVNSIKSSSQSAITIAYSTLPTNVLHKLQVDINSVTDNEWDDISFDHSHVIKSFIEGIGDVLEIHLNKLKNSIQSKFFDMFKDEGELLDKELLRLSNSGVISFEVAELN